MKSDKLNCILYIVVGALFIIGGLIWQYYVLSFIGLCLAVLGLTGGSRFGGRRRR